MKKKSSIFFALLFAATMAFGFGMASTVQATGCCVLPGCPGSKGHIEVVGGLSKCVRNWTHWCDAFGECQ